MQKGQININEHQLESLCNKLYTAFVLGNLIDEKDNSNDTYSKFCFLTSLALENLTDIETVVDGKKWTIDDNASVEDIKNLAERVNRENGFGFGQAEAYSPFKDASNIKDKVTEQGGFGMGSDSSSGVIKDRDLTIFDGKKNDKEYLKELAKRAKLKGVKTLQINPFSPDTSNNSTELNNAN